MKCKFYLLPFLLFLFLYSPGQDCSTFSFTYSTKESRCVATGSITVNVSGGSGDYNFKAIGPVNTPLTSSNIITGLAPGYYKVVVNDLTTGCSKEKDSVYVNGSYGDPRFQLVKTDASCLVNDGTISVANQQFGRSPFTYTIVAPSPSHIGETNTSGNFSGLIAGEYVIQLQDSCGGIQVRRITIDNYNWWYQSLLVERKGCDSANVFITLGDNKGNNNLSGTTFDGFQYGYVDNGDTTWTSDHDFSVFLGTKRGLLIVAKDNCGNIQSSTWTIPDNLKPAISNVSLSDLVCENFTASITGQNLTNPNFCLFDSFSTLISCSATGIFNNLPYGDYCIQVHDACYDTTLVRCFTGVRPVPSVGSSVSISNQTCSTFTATITGQLNLKDPGYCLYDTNDVQIVCNMNGVFEGLPYGSYCIKVHDACTDTVIVRCFTADKPVSTLTGFGYTGSGCDNFGVQIFGNGLFNPRFCLYDSTGSIVTCDSSGLFSNLTYGQYCVRAISCGDTTNSICFSGSRPVPSVGPDVQISQLDCTGFTVAITDQTNLSNPGYCLYNNNDSLITCDSTGIFNNVPYGSYCIKIHNNSICYDTTIVRCFTQLRPVPSVNSTMETLNSNCTTVSFKASGNNLTSPDFCLYNSSNTLLECNNSGIFNNYPFGQYCVTVHDNCIDTTMKVCQSFSVVKGISLTTSKSCTINSTNVDVSFWSSNSPYVIKAYHPNGSLVYNTTTSSNPYRLELSALPVGTQYKIIGTDNCGNKDSAFITPDANIVSKNTVVRGKCPGSVWTNGSGDIMATANSNYFGMTPEIIKKNGSGFYQSYSSVSNNTYTFADLEPAKYVVQYTQSVCGGKLYDTVTVSTYAYPSQGQSAVYQCDNNGFSLSADVKNGVGPFSYEIIGSLPEIPGIVSSPQTSAIFSINNGTTYSLIRLRTIDACGNATLSDVSVLPLQNISVRASDSCYYQNITLTVDTIPNASYTWYKKTTAVDSVLLDSGLTYNLPFFLPEQTGTYVCKVNVNNGCLVRVSSFSLPGSCYMQVLPTTFQLRGRKIGENNQLYWNNPNEKGVISYIVERKQINESKFITVGTVSVQTGNNYTYTDNNFNSGTSEYRLKVVYTNKTEYSNIVALKTNPNKILVYPNPVKNEFKIFLNPEKPTDYKIDLFSSNGQLLYSTELKSITSSMLTYTRTGNIKSGIYLLRIIDGTTNRTEIRKLVFE